jgi:hypothetical protein
MKKLTTIAGLLLASTSIFGQSNPIKLSLRGTFALPTGDWKLLQSTGGLVELQANKSLSDNFSLFGSVGYGRFAGKEGIEGTGVLPILAGLNIDGRVFHAGLGFGYTSVLVGGGSSIGGFTFRPEIGINLSKQVQLNLNYTSTNTKEFYVNYIGITPVIKF